jgi:Chloroplast import apparatus Tic20-like
LYYSGIEAFRITLDKVVREEKQAGIEADAQALLAKQTAEIAAAKVLAVTDQVNSLPPTGSDKVLSLLPYLLPLCDALPYARAFIQGNALDTNNPIFEFASFVFLLYQTIPFSGLVAFFLLSSFTSNLKLNRLVRFNIQQAIFLDIALIFPGIIGTVAFAVAKQGNFEIPLGLVDTASTATFLTASAAIIYSMGSTLAGALPDRIPFVSDRVKTRVPTADDILKMLEDQENMLKAQEQEKKINRKRRDRGESNDDKKE